MHLVQIRSRSKKRIGIREIVIIALVVAILVLSALSVLLYRQSNDYRDAKYRAQYLTVSYLVEDLRTASIYIPRLLSEPLALESRYEDGQWGLSAVLTAQQLTWTLEVMYMNDYNKNLTFRTMKQALSDFYDEGYSLLRAISQNMTAGAPYEDDPMVNNKLGAALSLMQGLIPYIESGMSSTDWRDHPYSLVSGMNLDGILDNSMDMIEVL